MPDVQAQRDQKIILAIIAFAVFVAILDPTIVNISLPTIAAWFQTDIGLVFWVVMASARAFRADAPLGLTGGHEGVPPGIYFGIYGFFRRLPALRLRGHHRPSDLLSRASAYRYRCYRNYCSGHDPPQPS